MIPGLTSDEERDLVLSVGLGHPRRVLNPVEVAELVQKAREAGATNQQLAERCLLETDGMFSKFLRLLRLAPEARHLVTFGRQVGSLSFTQAQEIAALDGHDLQNQLVDRALSDGINKDELRAVCQLIKRSGATVDDAADQILALRPQITRFFVMVGLVEGAEVKTSLAEMSQAARDDIFREVLQELAHRGSGHLSDHRFTVSTQDEREGSIDANQFEAAVNALLRERIL